MMHVAHTKAVIDSRCEKETRLLPRYSRITCFRRSHSAFCLGVEGKRLARLYGDPRIIGGNPTISFGYKIELLGNLADEIPALGSVVPKSLIKTLNSLRRVRNNFAHYPVTFIPNGSTSDQNLDIVLATHKAEYKIDNEYVARTDAIFKEADQGLKDANEAMRKNLIRDQDVTPTVGSAEEQHPKAPKLY
jgi:hypothetical protein